MKTWMIVFGTATALLACAGGARAADSSLDKYGGSTQLQCSAGPQPRFYTERIGDKWWLCTPAGNVFIAMGVYHVAPDNAVDAFGINHYEFVRQSHASGPTNDGLLNWSLHTAKRLKSWGFNTLDMYAYGWALPWAVRRSKGEWPLDPDTNTYTIPEKLPGLPPNIKPSYYALYNRNGSVDQPVKNLMTGIKNSIYGGWRGGAVADYFDDRFRAYMAIDWANDVWNHGPAVNADWILGVVVDDKDDLWWAGAGTDFQTIPAGKSGTHAGWVMLVTAPVVGAGWYRGYTSLFPNPEVYSKTHLQNVLTAKYGTIEALNEAWGSTYSSFGSTGIAVNHEEVGLGDGESTVFTHTLAQPSPSLFSIQVLVDGAIRAGDNGAGTFLNSSNDLRGVGAVNYQSGEATIVLQSPPPAGAAITVNYVSCGFGCGTGLLDEDGSHTWVPRVSNGNVMTGGNPQIRADLDDLLFQYASHYFSTVKAQVNVSFPGRMYIGPDTIGSWSAPPRRQVLQAAAQHVDVLRINMMDPMLVGDQWAERMNYVTTWGGDKPWIIYTAANANPDSYFANDPRGAPAGCTSTRFQSQAERGRWYQNLIRAYAGHTGDGIRHFVGVAFWEMLDNRRECANWGIMTRRDNPYDGTSAVRAVGTDAWGYPTGGEQADYGDVIGSMKAVNSIWLASVQAAGKSTVSGAKLSHAKVK